MKKLFALFVLGLLLICALPKGVKAQCPANADSNPCYSLPSGSCVCFPGGKLKMWLGVPIIMETKNKMGGQFPDYSFSDFLKAYYFEDKLQISYLGGTWQQGQSFQVSMGGGSVIIVIGDGL